MVDITAKSNSLRKATAVAVVSVSKQGTIEAIKNKAIPKGDVFEFSRAAGLLAIKKTSKNAQIFLSVFLAKYYYPY